LHAPPDDWLPAQTPQQWPCKMVLKAEMKTAEECTENHLGPQNLILTLTLTLTFTLTVALTLTLTLTQF
jgi:hypothetical protein